MNAIRYIMGVAVGLSAGIGYAGHLTISGDQAQLVLITLKQDSATHSVEVRLPSGLLQGLDLAGTKTLELTPADPEGRSRIKVSFANEPMLKLGVGRWIISDDVGATGQSSFSTQKQSDAGSQGGSGAQTNNGAPAGTKTGNDQDSGSKNKEEEPPRIVAGGIAFSLPEKSSLKDREMSYDASVPESPAASIIGSTASLIRFNDSKDASTQLLNIADADGNIRSGFSFAFHPYRLLAKPTLDKYIYGAEPAARGADFSGGRWVRFLSRLDLSLAATVDDPVEGKETRGVTAAVGLSGYIFNKADSRLHFMRYFKPEVPIAEGPVDPSQTNIGGTQYTLVSTEETARVAAKVYSSIWNDSYWAFGFAPRMRSESGNVADFSRDGGGLWTTYSYGFEGAGDKLGLGLLEDNSQLLLHANFRSGEHVKNPTDPAKMITEDTWVVAVQLRLGKDDFNVFGEVVWERHRPQGLPRRSTETYFIGLEKKLRNDLWLQVSLGSEETSRSSDRSALIRTALSYAFGDTFAAPAK